MLSKFSRFPGHGYLLALYMLVVAIAIGGVAYRFSQPGPVLDADMLKMMPQTEEKAEINELLFEFLDNYAKRQFYMVGMQNFDDAKLWVDKYVKALESTATVAKVDAHMSKEVQQEWLAYLWERRRGLLSQDTYERIQSQGMAGQTQHALEEIYSPFSLLSSDLLEGDPLFLFSDYMQNLNHNHSALKLDDGYLTIEKDGMHYIFFQIDLAVNGMDMGVHKELVPILDQLREDIVKADPKAEVLTGGFIRHASYSVKAAEAEVSLIGTVSIIATVGLLLFAFRSLWPLVITLLTLATSVVVALGLSLWWFDRLFVITIVFAVTLIGVAIDYCLHFFTDSHFASNQDENIGLNTVRHIRSGLILGMGTSLFAYLLLTIGSLKFMQQMAVVCGLGLMFSCFTVLVIYPLLPKRILARKGDQSTYLITAVERFLAFMSFIKQEKFTWARGLVMLGLLGFIGLGLARLPVDDNVRLLQAMSPKWLGEENKLRDLVKLQRDPAFILVRGDDEQSLLQLEESLAPALDQMVLDGTFDGYVGTSLLSPSLTKQAKNDQAFQLALKEGEPQFAEFLDNLGLTDAGKTVDSFYQFDDKPYLELSETLVELTPGLRDLYLGNMDGRFYSVIQFAVLKDKQALIDFAENTDNVFWIDQAAEVSSAFGLFRERASLMFFMAACLAALLWLFRYGFKRGIICMLPTILAIGFSLSMTSFFGDPLNLFHVLGLTIVFGVGADYSLFLQESRLQVAEGKADSITMKATLLAIFFSATTSCLSFGLLSLSSTMAVHAFGFSLVMGILAALVLSPFILLDRESLALMLKKA